MNDNEIRQMMALMDTYEKRSEALSQQIQVLQVSLQEVTLANQTVKALKDAKEGDEILMPVGASSFVTVKVTSNTNVIVGIGAGLSVEKTSDDATEYLNANIAEINEALKGAVDALNETQKAMSTVSNAIQQEYAVRKQANPNL